KNGLLPQRAKNRLSPHGTVYPIGDELHPTVCPLSLMRQHLRQVGLVVNIYWQTFYVPLKAGHVAPTPD
ncbi:hypothetical protein, partial [Bacillus cereus]|uniref:hypothetical protein n=1 Tax=Bacillus cereus TaxID=1396 RepID=UPI002852B066